MICIKDQPNADNSNTRTKQGQDGLARTVKLHNVTSNSMYSCRNVGTTCVPWLAFTLPTLPNMKESKKLEHQVIF